MDYKLIIAGSRHFPSLNISRPSDWLNISKVSKVYKVLEELLQECCADITHVVSGRCWGMDQLGEKWANANKKVILPYPANWDKYRKAAGPIRNKEMALVGDGLVCICTESSRGSNNIIQNMIKLNKPVWFRYVD